MSLPIPWSRPLQPPAYNVVVPPRSLQQHTMPVAQQPSSAMKPKKVEWPPAIRDYVRRAFEPDNAIDGISSSDMQEKLKYTISYYAERNMQEEIDWSTYPLPQELLREERDKAALTAMPPAVSAPGHTATSYPTYMNNARHLTNPTITASPQSKKRKSQDSDDLRGRSAEASANIPPWRRTNLEDRITYTSSEKRLKKSAMSGDSPSKFDQSDLEKRRQRFNLDKSGAKTTPPWKSNRNDSDSDMSVGPVVGTNQSLEKSYFRLTAPPKAETVRPLHVLEKTLAMLTKKWKAERNYNYICNQFKSLRQDLTVQHIKNSFTVKVYEIHARIALEKEDTSEYNQCQTQLKALYAQNLGGNPAEFTAYRILYFVYTCNKTDMNDMLAELTPADKAQVWIKHALDVRSALALGNYHKFFRLYLDAQNMGGYLMDMFIRRERLNALANISRAYTAVTLHFLTDELGFDSDEACREFIESCGAQQILEAKVDEKNGSYTRVKVREAASLFENLRAVAFSKVDIKGQI